MTATDVLRVVASVTGSGISNPIQTDLSIGGTPRTASGTILNIPRGSGRTITIEAFPALAGDAEGAVVIYRGQTTVDIFSGQIISATLVLYPVVADALVVATFPSGDTDVPHIDHVTVVTSGDRITEPATFYLTPNNSAGTASGTAARIPVGIHRTLTVKSFDSAGNQLHQGAQNAAIAEGGNSVAVTMLSSGSTGGASVDAGFCAPSCGSLVCGDNGCGGSCGGCLPTWSCLSGACVEYLNDFTISLSPSSIHLPRTSNPNTARVNINTAVKNGSPLYLTFQQPTIASGVYIYGTSYPTGLRLTGDQNVGFDVFTLSATDGTYTFDVKATNSDNVVHTATMTVVVP